MSSWQNPLYSKLFFVLRKSLCDSKSVQVSRTLLSILTNLNNAVVWIIFIRPLIFNSSSPLTKPLEIVLSALITIGITVTFMFHSFYTFLIRFKYLSHCSFSFILILWSSGTAKPIIRQVLFFLFKIIPGSGLLGRDLFVSQNPREFCEPHSQERNLIDAYTMCLYGQISVSCTITSGSTCTLFALVCFIR